VRRSNVETSTLKEANYMGIGLSIFLIAVGAILAWAVSLDTNGIDLNMVGVILMIVGILGLLLSLIFWSTWGGVGGWRRETVYREGGDPYYDRRPMP
jgi:hypothetical protein